MKNSSRDGLDGTSPIPDPADDLRSPATDDHADTVAHHDHTAPAAQPTATGAGHTGEHPTAKSGGKLGSAWVGLVLGSLILIVLLVFVVQNSASTDVAIFGWQFSLPLGVLVLFAAIAGALVMALFAGFRILQLRMRARKERKLAVS